MQESDIQNAELALAITLHKSIPNLKGGRLKNLLVKLAVESEKQINKLKRPTRVNLDKIKVCLDKFSESSGWGKSQKHLQTYVNSILLILEDRDYPKINKILIEIVDYQERAKKIPSACFWSAEVVRDKWVESFKGE